MHEIGAFEAKNTLGALLDRVEQGEEILITRHGRPVARLAPANARSHPEQAREAIARIRARAAKLKPDLFDWNALKTDRDRDRP